MRCRFLLQPPLPPGGYPAAGYPPPPPPPARSGQCASGSALTTDQVAKLRRELEVVQGNIHVMSDMLTELSPATVDPSDLELLQVNYACVVVDHRLFTYVLIFSGY